MADDGRLKKMEVDYTSTVEEKIPECDKLAKVRIAKFMLAYDIKEVRNRNFET